MVYISTKLKPISTLQPTQHCDGTAHQQRHQPHHRDLEEYATFGRTVSGAQRISDASVPANTDEAHVQDARRTGEHITGHVDVAPCQAERPVTCRMVIICCLLAFTIYSKLIL